MRETVLAKVAQRSPTSPETNLESRAMQVRVPWTQAWLCTKDFRQKCTGAGVAAKVAVPSNAAQRAVTPPKVVKGQKKSPKSGKSSTAEKAAIVPAVRDATASSIITGQETTARVSALEGSSIVTGPETTARVSALEGSSIVTGPETTARVSALEGSSIVTGPETTARVSAPEGSSIVSGPETTARVSALEGPGSHSPAGH
ncbi:hypothetical protein NDU88_013314 [Pleurodeles waltl]|uniref:Uncharacterized protein n=1 Tax=Pleurodeles waltl TaxID=8319 RepID=A0AAV7R5A1_PLEWA|nr:hypothetical protein NDU88_013314 [Pleurodeles waltl]